MNFWLAFSLYFPVATRMLQQADLDSFGSWPDSDNREIEKNAQVIIVTSCLDLDIVRRAL